MKKIIVNVLCLLMIINCLSCSYKDKVNNNSNELSIESKINATVESMVNDITSEDNDLFSALDYIKGVHPGTAGCSIQVLYGCVKLMNVCKSRMALELMVNDWISKQDKNLFSDINESFNFLFETLKRLKTNGDKELKDSDIEIYDGNWDDSLCDKAISLANIVVEATK